MKPLAIDLFTGLHGWSVGLVEVGYDVIGFDIADMSSRFGHPRPADVHLAIQDVLTLHGAQFRDAALIVASPPCQAYSYRAMPWSRAKALPPPDNALFDACFRIQREACAAAGRHIPLVVENVKGAQPWVGRAAWHFGSYYLWGDVPALMPIAARPRKFNPDRIGHATKTNGGSWFAVSHNKEVGNSRNPVEGYKGTGSGAAWFDGNLCRLPSASSRRREASALIARIPAPLARHIGWAWHPDRVGVF